MVELFTVKHDGGGWSLCDIDGQPLSCGGAGLTVDTRRQVRDEMEVRVASDPGYVDSGKQISLDTMFALQAKFRSSVQPVHVVDANGVSA